MHQKALTKKCYQQEEEGTEISEKELINLRERNTKHFVLSR